MPVMWFAKDGARPHSQSGPGTSVSVEEAREIIGSHEIRFAGPEAPSINPNHPSSHANNVVLEVSSPSDGGGTFAQTGFYVVVGLNPHEAERILGAMRGEVQLAVPTDARRYRAPLNFTLLGVRFQSHAAN